jgi:hypothetical protein
MLGEERYTQYKKERGRVEKEREYER